jgi:hypothetical protein
MWQFRKVDICKTNWPKDSRLNYNSHINSIKLIETLMLKEKDRWSCREISTTTIKVTRQWVQS